MDKLEQAARDVIEAIKRNESFGVLTDEEWIIKTLKEGLGESDPEPSFP